MKPSERITEIYDEMANIRMPDFYEKNTYWITAILDYLDEEWQKTRLGSNLD